MSESVCTFMPEPEFVWCYHCHCFSNLSQLYISHLDPQLKPSPKDVPHILMLLLLLLLDVNVYHLHHLMETWHCMCPHVCIHHEVPCRKKFQSPLIIWRIIFYKLKQINGSSVNKALTKQWIHQHIEFPEWFNYWNECCEAAKINISQS
jgi:hypothetical protein